MSTSRASYFERARVKIAMYMCNYNHISYPAPVASPLPVYCKHSNIYSSSFNHSRQFFSLSHLSPAAFSFPSTSCAVCDYFFRRVDISLILAENVPNPSILRAGDNLASHPEIMALFMDYPGDTTNCLDGLVLAKEGFETEEPHHLRICIDCLRDLKRKNMSYAALANGLWVGDMPEHLADSTWVELAAASPVRTSGMVFALEQLKVGSISGSAQRMMRGTFTFFFQNAYGVQVAIPSCDADIAGSMTCAFVGPRPSEAQLRKIFGADRQRILELMKWQQDASNRLAGEHILFRRASRSQENLDSFPEDGSVPRAILNSFIQTSDPDKTRQKSRSTYVPDNREAEVPVADDDAAADTDEDGVVIDNVGVIPFRRRHVRGGTA